MSASELFDVVDEHDNVTDVRQRSDVHRLGLRHRAAHIFLFRPDGRLLIHRRADNKEEFPSVWTSSASGHVSSGESYDVSAERELEEELGVRAPLTFLLKVDACPDTCNEFTKLYTAVSEDDVSPDPEEISAIAWVTPDQLRQRMQQPANFSPAFLLLYERYCQRVP
ncbi:MAG: NUDIX domain-containing protein [Planctomycetaceae bacterium]|nr:NUDIX domain-containing protein [Planctomycetaceae bacterium]